MNLQLNIATLLNFHKQICLQYSYTKRKATQIVRTSAKYHGDIDLNTRIILTQSSRVWYIGK